MPSVFFLLVVAKMITSWFCSVSCDILFVVYTPRISCSCSHGRSGSLISLLVCHFVIQVLFDINFLVFAGCGPSHEEGFFSYSDFLYWWLPSTFFYGYVWCHKDSPFWAYQGIFQLCSPSISISSRTWKIQLTEIWWWTWSCNPLFEITGRGSFLLPHLL